MLNYEPWSNETFKTTMEEVDNLPDHPRNSITHYKENLARVQERFGQSVVWFRLKKVPQKRSNYDHASLLVFQKEDGQFWAKRHNNSQFFKLEY